MMGTLYSKCLREQTKITTVGPSFDTKSDIEAMPGDKICPIIEKMDEKPDAIVSFYSKPDYFPPDLWQIDLPKLWYVYDTHIHLDELAISAYLFDLVICTDHPTQERMAARGIHNVTFLGFAADRETYFRESDPKRERKYQIGFAGSAQRPPSSWKAEGSF